LSPFDRTLSSFLLIESGLLNDELESILKVEGDSTEFRVLKAIVCYHANKDEEAIGLLSNAILEAKEDSLEFEIYESLLEREEPIKIEVGAELEAKYAWLQ